METERDIVKMIEYRLPFELQKKFAIQAMDKFETVDLRSVPRKKLIKELAKFIERENAKMFPFTQALKEMLNELNTIIG